MLPLVTSLSCLPADTSFSSSLEMVSVTSTPCAISWRQLVAPVPTSTPQQSLALLLRYVCQYPVLHDVPEHWNSAVWPHSDVEFA